MAMIESWFEQDLKKPVQVQRIDGNVFSQDNQANLIGVSVFDDGAPATLSGTVSASVIRQDGATVSIATGTLSGNKCSVILPSTAYAVPGQIAIIIKLTSSSVVTTMLAVTGMVYRTSTDTVVYPGEIIPSIQQVIEDLEQTVRDAQDALDGIEDQKNTMIASIASVAGMGTDTTLTQSGVAADAKSAGDKISDLKSALTNEIRAGQVIESSDIVQGSIGSNPEVATDNPNRIRVKGLIPIYKGMGVSFVPGSNTQQINCIQFNSSKSEIKRTGWIPAHYETVFEEDGYLGIVYSKIAGTEISYTDYDATTIVTSYSASEFNRMDFAESTMTGGDVFSFGNNWSIEHNGTAVNKSNDNTFELDGTHTGSYRYVLLSSDDGSTANDWTAFSSEKVNLKLVEGHTYNFIAESMMSASMTPSLDAVIHLIKNTDGTITDDVTGIRLSQLEEEGTTIEKEFVAGSDLYGVVLRLSSEAYLGAFRIYIKDLTEEKTTAKIQQDIIGIRSDLINKEKIYRNFTILTASINADNGKINSNSSCRTVGFECEPNSTYYIKKTAGGRFSVGESTVIPATNVTLTSYVVDNTASEIKFTTSSTAKYIAAFVYYSSTDTDITAPEMCDSVEIYKETVVERTEKRVEPFVLTLGNRSIHDKCSNKPFFRFPASFTNKSLQGISKYGEDLYIFCNKEVIKYSANGVKIPKEVNEFDHVQSTQSIGDGVFVVASAENYGTAQEARKVYFYNFATNTIISSFVPQVTGNLIFAYQRAENDYVIGVWVDNANVITLYNYNSSDDSSTLIGSVDLLRRYFQGGTIVGNILYAATNNGGYSPKQAAVQMIDLSSMEIINTFDMIGFGENEGFDIECDKDGNTIGYFTDNTEDRVYKMKLW